jgi:hypothetical protein
MLSCVPLDGWVDERSGTLKHWVHTCMKGNSPAKWLAPEGWFDLSAQQGGFMWCPLPVITNAVLEQVYNAQQRHPQTSAHLCMCPRIMISRWRKKLCKAATCSFRIPITSSTWGAGKYEPMIVYVCLFVCMYVCHYPNIGNGTCGQLSSWEMWKGVCMGCNPSLKPGLGSLCEESRSVETLSRGVVRQMLRPDEMGQVSGESAEEWRWTPRGGLPSICT